ncbi:DNA-binding response regulator, NarL/FixJ family, contains REC and HTH domains [Chitinophaga costaii]|uniref:DNA-binding response regulator, NarL/FixJ family, contains REC and HTH domains n=1 Tax=Chitinophaga costaii TaxID=1335309 RepID=A0A1C3YST6_9BACT|nr:response regulator transcription factor [Chitinophaga costaii]PUZ30091.1 DNA-binding response regulator [Chitinophaga costaii]SCB73175.1 DNA-binding response regulator, NarL/FixJ family, contains REC and HTH domains [Chitinophaga costaii]
MELINLGMVNEHTVFRELLKAYFSTRNIDMVLHVGSVTELMGGLKRTRVDLLLMDTLLIKANGNDIIRMLRDQYPGMKILVISSGNDMDIMVELLDLGIHGCISKDEEPEELLRAIVSAANNRIYRNSLFTEALYFNKEHNLNTEIDETIYLLDRRDKVVLQYLWEEKSNKEIAQSFSLSVRSIEKIRQDMKEKLGVKSTIGLLKYGIDKGIIQPGLIKSFMHPQTSNDKSLHRYSGRGVNKSW